MRPGKVPQRKVGRIRRNPEKSKQETEEYGGTDETEKRWRLGGEEGGQIRTILKNQGSGEMGVSCVLAVEYLEEGQWRQIWKTEEETEEILDPGEIREEEFIWIPLE